MCVACLRQTWMHVDKLHHSLFAALEKLVMPEGNRASYRRMLRSAVKMTTDTREFTLSVKRTVEPCFPFLATVCSDFAFCEIGNKSSMLSYQARGMPVGGRSVCCIHQ